MDDLFSISTASFALAGTIFTGFKRVDGLATEELKSAIYEWVQAKPKTAVQAVMLRDLPLVRGIKPPDALSNLFYTLILFLVLLFTLNVGYAVFGEAGVLRATSGEIALGFNPEHIAAQAEKYGGFLHEISVDPQLALNLLLVIVVIGVINLLPSHVNLLVSRSTARLSSFYVLQPLRLLGVYLFDLLFKVALTIFIAVTGLSLLAALIDGGGFFQLSENYLGTWLQAVSFSREQTVIQAAFYSALYINVWFFVCYLSLILTRLLYWFDIGRHSLRYFKVREQPFTVMGTLASSVTVVVLLAGYAVAG